MENKIISKAPGRVCLFGDHQDYLGLPIIATTIDKEITIKAIKNNTEKFKIFKKNKYFLKQKKHKNRMTQFDKPRKEKEGSHVFST